MSLELASSQLLDPAASLVLASSAHHARTASDMDQDDRALAESDLTAALVAALDSEDIAEVRTEPAGADMLDELDAACRRVPGGRHRIR